MLAVSKDPKGYGLVVINGPISAEDMRAGLDTFLDILPDEGKLPFLYDVQHFAFPEFEAITEKMRDLPAQFKALGHMNKVALLADPAWLRTVAEFEGMLIPGLTIRSFEPSERAEAEAWLVSDD